MLNDKALRALKPGRHPDMGGLLVVVTGSTRTFRFRYQLNGKRQEMTLGRFPSDLTLAQARAKAAELRAMVKDGIDPRAKQEPEQEPEASVTVTFTQAAAAYIRAHRRGWSNPKHARQWCATLKTYARPVLGNLAVSEVSTGGVLQVLKPIWNVKTETAKRVQGRIENVLDYAAAHEWRDSANPARWRGHLDKLLPRPAKVAKVKHRPAMPYPDVPAFFRELEAVEGFGSLALRFQILTATRSGEVLGATWDEIDLGARTWTIPAERMKAKREHRVPLSSGAVATLEALPRLAAEPWLFPGGKRGRPLSNMALLQRMRRLGYGVNGTRGDFVPHGFRSSFRDFCSEVSNAPNAVAEMALAHVIESKTEAAYARSDLFERRRTLMQEWSDWVVALA